MLVSIHASVIRTDANPLHTAVRLVARTSKFLTLSATNPYRPVRNELPPALPVSTGSF